MTTPPPQPNIEKSDSVASLNNYMRLSLSDLANLTSGVLKEPEKIATEDKFLSIARELYKYENIDAFSDIELLKFLLSHDYHIGKGLESLSESLSWRHDQNIDSSLLSENFSDLDATGKLQFFGRTRTSQYPVLVFRNDRHLFQKDPQLRDRDNGQEEKGTKSQSRVLVDKMTVIVDRFNTTNAQMDTSLFKLIVPILQKHYPERLAHMVIFPNNTYFWMAWKLGKNTIDTKTLKKISIVDDPVCLQGLIDREFLFERYGGLAKDMYDKIDVGVRVRVEESQTSPTSDTTEVEEAQFSIETESEPHDQIQIPSPTDTLTPPTEDIPTATHPAEAEKQAQTTKRNLPELPKKKQFLSFAWKKSAKQEFKPEANAKPKTLVPDLRPVLVELLWQAPDEN